MPHVLDRSEQLINELKTSRMFGKEIQSMSPADRASAVADLLPLFEAAVSLIDLQKFNEKCRKWIDQHPQP